MRLVLSCALVVLLLSSLVHAAPNDPTVTITVGNVPPVVAGSNVTVPVQVEYCYPAQFAAPSSGPTQVKLTAKVTTTDAPSIGPASDAESIYGSAAIVPQSLDFPVATGAGTPCVKLPANLTIQMKEEPPFGVQAQASVNAVAAANGLLSSAKGRADAPVTVQPVARAARERGSPDAGTASGASILQAPFAPQNQNVTFFVLGLAVTGAGAWFGVARIRSKRQLLQAEMRAAEATAARLAEDTLPCEDALRAHRAHAKDLLEAGRLDEGQYALLDSHVAKLILDARRHAVDRELSFLPTLLLKDVNDVLADGRMTFSEHRRLMEALQGMTLAPHDEARARALFDGWAERDSAAAMLAAKRVRADG